MNNEPKSKPMRFQMRDQEIMKAIYKYDGVLARRQIKNMFWPSASTKAMERRLSLLHSNYFLDWPSEYHRRVHPIPEPVVWLGWRGIQTIIGEYDLDIKPPINHGENQLRLYARRLRDAGVRWQREPRWSQLAHDIAVNDFRMAVEQSAQLWPSISLETWMTEGDFLTDTDRIDFSMTNRNGKKIQKQRGIRPDGFFILQDHIRRINGTPARSRCLLEYDNSTHPLNRFGKEKAIAGLAYIRSKEYKNRFGYNSGRWLVVCKSPLRMKHLKEQTEQVLENDAHFFLFTTLDKTTPETILNTPIWLHGGSNEAESLITTL